MAKKRDVKAIISNKSLTGKEAARLIISHFVETDHQRPRLLTPAEITQIRSNVSRMADTEIETFNASMHLYQVIGYTLKEAEVLHLEISIALLQALHSLDPIVMAWRLRNEQYNRPAIVTRRQFEDMQARARERKLQELHCLNQVILWRTKARDSRVDIEDIPEDEWDNLWHQCSAEIQELIDSGKLQPMELELRADDGKLRYGEERPAGYETVDQCYTSFASDTSPEEIDRQCRNYVTGEQLYQAGLPEWQKWIDEYDHHFEWETQGLPEAERGAGIAVLEEPVYWPIRLDERGYYKAKSLVEICDLPVLEQVAKETGRGTHKQLLQKMHKIIRKKLRVFLAHRPIFEALSDLIGVKLDEDMEAWTESIEREVNIYKATLDIPLLKRVPKEERWMWRDQPEWLERKPELPPFTIDDLKPDPKHVQYLKERMSLVLGDQAAEVFGEWLQERCLEIDDTEDRLAEEVREDGEGEV